MSEKLPRNLDAALAALARAERAARPGVSPDLRARVLSDAAEVAAELSARRPAAAARGGRARAGLLDRLRDLDLWAGAAVAAALLCLVIGLGVGYGAADSVLAGAGLGGEVRVAQADEGDGVFLGGDVL